MVRMSDADRAVEVLQRGRRPLHYRDLIRRVIRAQDGADDATPHRMAAVYTQLNVDSRFVYHGQGIWGLSAWEPYPGADKTSGYDTAARPRATEEGAAADDSEA